VHPLLLAYLAGVALGLWKVDAPIGGKIGLAALWPVGVLAAAVTVPLLIGAALVLFPVLGAVVVGGGVAGWWFLR
jgi:hypothetical protein